MYPGAIQGRGKKHENGDQSEGDDNMGNGFTIGTRIHDRDNMLRSIQELDRRIEQLETSIEHMKDQIQTLIDANDKLATAIGLSSFSKHEKKGDKA